MLQTVVKGESYSSTTDGCRLFAALV